MGHQEERRPVLPVCGAQQVGEFLLVGGRKGREDFVEHQQLRSARQRPGDLQPAQAPLGQARAGKMPLVVEAGARQQRLRGRFAVPGDASG